MPELAALCADYSIDWRYLHRRASAVEPKFYWGAEDSKPQLRSATKKQRVQRCKSLLERLATDGNYHWRVIWIDESAVTCRLQKRKMPRRRGLRALPRALPKGADKPKYQALKYVLAVNAVIGLVAILPTTGSWGYKPNPPYTVRSPTCRCRLASRP